jgi:hypothetical protein
MSWAEDVIREGLEARLRRRIPPAIWAEIWDHCRAFGLDDLPDIDDCVVGLLPDARRYLRVAQAAESGRAIQRPPRRVPAYTAPEALVAQDESRRSDVMSVVSENLATTSELVMQFRGRYLGGVVASPAEAIRFVASPVFALLSRYAIEGAGMPTSGLRSKEIPLPQLNRAWEQQLPNGQTIYARRHLLRCEWGEGEKRELDFYVPFEGGQLEPSRTLKWFRPGLDAAAETSCLPGSVLDDLRNVAENVAWKLWWREPAAVWFVLTGEVPRSQALSVEITSRVSKEITQARIILQVPPWVSPPTVARVYANARRWTLGRRPRRREIAGLELFAHAFGRRAKADPETWAETYSHMPRRKGKKRGNWRRLQRDYVRIERALLHPIYAMGGDIVSLERRSALWREIRTTRSEDQRLAARRELRALPEKTRLRNAGQ